MSDPPRWNTFLGGGDPEARARLQRLQVGLLMGGLALGQLAGLLAPEAFTCGEAGPELVWLPVFLVQALGAHLAVVELLRAARARWRGEPRLAWAALGLALLLGGPTAWELAARPWPATLSGVRIRVRTANLLSLRDPDPRLVSEVLAGREDVLVLTEYTPAWDARLRPELEARLPFVERVPREDSFGIAVYSRYPFSAAGKGWLPLIGHGLPQLRVPLEVEGRRVEVLAVHTLPPRNLEYARGHRVMVARLLAELDLLEGPTLVVGDLNFGPGTPQQRALLRRGYTDAGGLEGYASTWPVLGPLRWLPGLRLDHVFASRHFGVTAARRGEGWGSDHRPVEVELVLRGE